MASAQSASGSRALRSTAAPPGTAQARSSRWLSAAADDERRCVAAPAETAASARRSGSPHVGTTPPVSLVEVKQQRCPGGCVLAGPGPRRRPQALGLAGGARSISRLPGRRAARFPKRNRHERGDRTSAFPRRQSPAADVPRRVQRRQRDHERRRSRTAALPRQRSRRRRGAHDRFRHQVTPLSGERYGDGSAPPRIRRCQRRTTARRREQSRACRGVRCPGCPKAAAVGRAPDGVNVTPFTRGRQRRRRSVAAAPVRALRADPG